jgi:FlgO protein
MRISRWLVLTLTSVAMAGCVRFEDPPQVSCAYTSSGPIRAYGNTLPELTYAAVQKVAFCAGPSISDRVPIIVSSITDSRRLETSSTFGNVVADFARTRLAQMHMDVSEPRLRSSMLLKTDKAR